MMATTTGTSAGARPQQSQNFRPKSEWKHEEGASFLFVYLPGFVMEQLTITPDYSNRTVRIEGQRRLPNNRLLPVDETFSIPQDYDLAKMDNQLGRGILMIKLPRNVVPQPVPQAQTTKETKEETPETSKPQETVGDSMTPKGEETDPSKETSTTGFEKQSPDKAVIISPVTTIGDDAVSTKRIDEKSAMTAGKSDEEKLVEQNANGNPTKTESPKNLVQNAGVKEEESKESAIPSAITADEKEKEKSRKSADNSGDAKGKETKKENVNTSAKKGMVKEPNEDKKLIVNMGAAVLVIVGLGVSLYYTLRS